MPYPSSAFTGTFWTIQDGDFYVSTTGNDITGTGSPNNPLLTVAKAFELATDNQKIVIGPNEYIAFDAGSDGTGGALIPCRLATVTNIPLSGLVTVDGIATNDGDRVLVWKQNLPLQNGIYIVSTGAWQREPAFSTADNMTKGVLVPIAEGNTNSKYIYQHTTVEDITVGLTEIVFENGAVTDWGGIGGDITAQTDLNGLIDDKLTPLDQAITDIRSAIVSPIEGYDNVYYVKDQNGDDSTAAPNSKNYFKTINAASDAARLDYDTNGSKNIVYVLRDTYNEKSVVRNHVDMYFDEDTVVWTSGSGNSVINDIPEIMDGVRIFGGGIFVSQDTNPGDDREGINIRKASKFYIEAKRVDNVQVWKNDSVQLELRNMEIIFSCSVHQNKSVKFFNCKFLNGCRLPGFGGNNVTFEFESCEFILQQYDVDNILNTTIDIDDATGNSLFRLVPPGGLSYPLDTENKTNDDIIEEVYTTYTSGGQLANPYVSCILYSQNDYFFNIGSLKVEFRGCKCVIKRENCNGIIISKRRNSSTTEGYLVFNDMIVLDETVNQNTTALVTGWGNSATRQAGFMLNAVSSNCKYPKKVLHKSLNPWQSTFDNLGVQGEAIKRLHDIQFEEGNGIRFVTLKAGSRIDLLSSQSLAQITFERFNGTSYEPIISDVEMLNQDLLSLTINSYHKFRLNAIVNTGDVVGNLLIDEYYGVGQIDIQSPVFLEGPTPSNITATSLTVYTKLSENGKLFFKLLNTGDPLPDETAIMNESSYEAEEIGSGSTIDISGLTPSTSYDIYAVGKDLNGNVGPMTSISIMTTV